ncbi:MAG TPA: hypothetical protein PKY30_08405 [Myxococcota bacterium]|nr:hypothetical protein [Myxococcota bacterium]HND31502.1 hypothetical protein [Myxococcota bacterium]HNH47045.1 hypothetical protein [Myxococcota bacterium]
MVTDTSSRLNEISSELASILEARIQELAAAMKASEQATRQIVATELEITRHRQIQDTMGPELSSLNSELEALKGKVEEQRQEHIRASAARDEARGALVARQGELREAEAEGDRLRSQARKLEEEGEVLRRENNELKGKIRSLEENVARMRKIKEEWMASIAGLNQQMGSIGSKD